MNGTKQTIGSTYAESRTSKSPRSYRKQFVNEPQYNDEKKYEEFVKAVHLRKPSPQINIINDYRQSSDFKHFKTSRLSHDSRYRTQ